MAPAVVVVSVTGRAHEYSPPTGAATWLADELEKLFWRDYKGVVYAITCPATWLHERRLRMTGERYKELITARLSEIRKRGQREKYMIHFPKYLLKCLQEYFSHHGDDLYDNLKHIRNAIDLAFDPSKLAPEATDCTVDLLAEANRLVRSHRRRNTSPKDPQLKLF